MEELVYLEDNIIKFHRGDTYSFSIDLLIDEGIPYELKDTDKLVFTVKKTVNTSKVLIQKTITSDLSVIIEHADTADLAYGNYVYDVQLTQAGGIVQTVIGPCSFILEDEVNWDE